MRHGFDNTLRLYFGESSIGSTPCLCAVGGVWVVQGVRLLLAGSLYWTNQAHNPCAALAVDILNIPCANTKSPRTKQPKMGQLQFNKFPTRNTAGDEFWGISTGSEFCIYNIFVLFRNFGRPATGTTTSQSSHYGDY